MKNKMKYPILKPLIFTLIMFFLIQPVKTTQIFTATCKSCAESSIFFEGQAKMMKNEVLNLEKKVFLHQSNNVLSFAIIKHDQLYHMKKFKSRSGKWFS